MAPYAQGVAAATGLRAGVILALMGEETAYGKSRLAGENNMSGIKYVHQARAAGNDNGFATYRNLNDWASDMTRVLELPDYAALRATAGESASAQIQALAESPYNGAPYSQRMQWAQLLEEVYQEQGLAVYDGDQAPAAPPPPAPAPQASPTGGPNISSANGTIVIAGVAGVGALVLIAKLAEWLFHHPEAVS